MGDGFRKLLADLHERESHSSVLVGDVISWIDEALLVDGRGRFENQDDGTARCAGCGFRIQGLMQAIKITPLKDVRSAGDDELGAIALIHATLAAMPEDARTRALRYLCERFGFDGRSWP